MAITCKKKTDTVSECAKTEDNHRSILLSIRISKIFRHSTGFINCTSVLTNSVILMGLPNAPQNLFSNYSHPFYQLSKPGFSDTVTLSTNGVVWMRCGFWKITKICYEYIQPRGLYSCNSNTTFDLTCLSSTELFPLKMNKTKRKEAKRIC